MVTVKQLMDDNNLELIAGSNGLNNHCKVDLINRLGLELTGFFECFENDRVILLGAKETLFLSRTNESIVNIRKIFEYKPPCIVFSEDAKILNEFILYAEEFNVPILKSKLKATPTSSKLYSYLHACLAPVESIHGTLLDINGMGTLIIGKSGIGKSEIALDLVRKGYQLIADDSVNIIEKEPGMLVGSSPDVLKQYIEIRGIGIVNVVKMFGVGAYRPTKKIDLVVLLEEWEKGKKYDRLGLDEDYIRYFDTYIRKVTIPITVGRSMSLLVESAAMNEKLKILGHNTALEFVENIDKKTRNGG